VSTLPPDGYAQEGPRPSGVIRYNPQTPTRNHATTLAIGRVLSDRLLGVAAQARARLAELDDELDNGQ
jgi:hypothetical protein